MVYFCFSNSLKAFLFLSENLVSELLLMIFFCVLSYSCCFLFFYVGVPWLCYREGKASCKNRNRKVKGTVRL